MSVALSEIFDGVLHSMRMTPELQHKEQTVKEALSKDHYEELHSQSSQCLFALEEHELHKLGQAIDDFNFTLTALNDSFTRNVELCDYELRRL